MSKSASCSFLVIGPRFPFPICIWSIDLIGDSSAADPVKNTSSAKYSLSRDMISCDTSYPRSSAIVITVSLVIPRSTDEPRSGVYILPSSIKKMFSPDPSATFPD